MKKILAFLFIIFSCQAFAQNVGIGTTSPKARLHVTDSAVLFTGPLTLSETTAYDPPASGGGTRLMWYPQKGAFRAGTVFDAEWNKDSIGLNSFASGSSTIATGKNSISMGNLNRVSGFSAVGLGYFNVSAGEGSVGLGFATKALKDFSTSMGSYTTANGIYSTSMGNRTVANGIVSTSMGYATVANGDYSTSMGGVSVAAGDYSTSMGFGTQAYSYASLAIGRYNAIGDFARTDIWEPSDPVFSVGIGSSELLRNNALTVLKNGSVGIGANGPRLNSGGYGLHIRNNSYSQLRLESTTSNAGIEFNSYAGSTFEIGATNDNTFYLYNRTQGLYRLLVDFAGNVGIGTDVPTQKLHVIGNVLANNVTVPSDLRYKKDIQSIKSPIQKIQAIRGVTYRYKTAEFAKNQFPSDNQVGVIAQEVEAVLPEVVITDKNGYKAVDYSKIVPLLIEGMKEQQKVIQSLNDRIEKLEKRTKND